MFTLLAQRVNWAARVSVLYRLASLRLMCRQQGLCGSYRDSWARPHTNEPRPRARVVWTLRNWTCFHQQVTELPALYRTWTSELSSSQYWFLSYVTQIQSAPSRPIYFRSLFMLCSKWSLPFWYSNQNTVSNSCHAHACCMLHPSIITLLGEQYKSWISSLRDFLRLQITDVHTGRAGCVQAHTDVQGGKKSSFAF
jgi:hypothetical protein